MVVEMSPVAKQWNDGEIMSRLAQARQAVGAVPADFIAAAKSAYACTPPVGHRRRRGPEPSAGGERRLPPRRCGL